MAYDSTKPQSGITLSAGRAVVQANFAATETYIARDHVSFDANSADSGKHKAIRLTEQTAPTTLVNELGLYAKDTGSHPDLFVRRESSGTEIQMTVGDPTAAATGQTFLPGGIIMKWGSNAIISGAGGTTVTFGSAFPTACFGVWLEPIDPTPKSHTVISKSTANFVARAENAITVMWWAIGN